MKIRERVVSPTPKFFKKIRTIGLTLVAISGIILASPVSLPAALTSIAGYAGLAGGVMSTISQLTVEGQEAAAGKRPIKRKITK